MKWAEKDIEKLFNQVLTEFPVKEINIDMPVWVEKLSPDHWLKKEFFKIVKGMCQNINKIKDIKPIFNDAKNTENLGASALEQINLGDGTAKMLLKPSEDIFYKVLSENCDVNVSSESDLIVLIKELNAAKKEYDKLDKDDIKMMLDKEKVNCKYNTAPACGLYLVNVYY